MYRFRNHCTGLGIIEQGWGSLYELRLLGNELRLLGNDLSLLGNDLRLLGNVQ